MAGEETLADEERSIEHTPTWGPAAVITVFVLVGLIVVYLIERIEKLFSRKRRRAFLHALNKMKEELMLLGFISLLLTVFKDSIEKICIKDSIMDKWNPCPVEEHTAAETPTETTPEAHGRRLFALNSMHEESLFHGRILTDIGYHVCKEGHSSVVSAEGLHQLHTYIFVLACVHLVYSMMVVILAYTKVKGWREWEDEAQSTTPQDLGEIARTLTMLRNKSFVEHRTKRIWQRNWFLVWGVCFVRQFTNSVSRSDYLSLRQGFIVTHNISYKFDFHRYMLRTLGDEFPIVVTITPVLWMIAVLTVLFNLNGVNLYFWMSLVPVVIVLVVGTKLQHIIATLALDNAGITHHGRYREMPLKPRDDLFWFNRPKLMLFLIHFVLFQNAFEMTIFLCFLWSFGWNSCMLKRHIYVYIRLGIVVVLQVVCSYSTLPLYVIVTQMGSHYKRAIFQAHIQDKLHRWRKGAKHRVKMAKGRTESIEALSESDDDDYTQDESVASLEYNEDLPYTRAARYRSASSQEGPQHGAGRVRFIGVTSPEPVSLYRSRSLPSVSNGLYSRHGRHGEEAEFPPSDVELSKIDIKIEESDL